AVGLYPLMYVFASSPISIIEGKGTLGAHPLWLTAFYLHIILGGVALLVGWPQFFPKWRNRHLPLHRKLGKVYIGSILLVSGPTSFFLAFFAFGGIGTKMGFGLLAIFWFTSTLLAFLAVRRKQISSHKEWMIRSYALSLAAVSLRIYMPIMQAGFRWDFEYSYSWVAWICWIPNILVAEWIIFRQRTNFTLTS
ncbi:MAG: DUF2306 domain-containing protein, partial [Bacteroidota bacterium]